MLINKNKIYASCYINLKYKKVFVTSKSVKLIVLFFGFS